MVLIYRIVVPIKYVSIVRITICSVSATIQLVNFTIFYSINVKKSGWKFLIFCKTKSMKRLSQSEFSLLSNFLQCRIIILYWDDLKISSNSICFFFFYMAFKILIGSFYSTRLKNIYLNFFPNISLIYPFN